MPPWDGTPRAVVPNDNLLQAKHPVQPTGLQAESSPQAFGISVYIDGHPQPIFYVSQKVANERRIASGWYTRVKAGAKFNVAVTNVHRNGVNVCSTDSVGAKLYVDGQSVFGSGHYKMANPGSEHRMEGFIVAREYSEGETRYKQRIREFVAEKRVTVEQGAADEPLEGTGSIVLHILQGRYEEVANFYPMMENEYMNSSSVVAEKDAIKAGVSLGVSRNENEITQNGERGVARLRDYYVTGKVTLHMREGFWLKSKNICDSEGNAWRPSPKTKKVQMEKKKKRRKKIPIFDKIDLTKTVVIDLTVDDN